MIARQNTESSAFRSLLWLALAVSCPLGFQSAHAAGDVSVGRKKARLCAACHGLDGKAKLPEAPDLAGQSETYLAIALTAYKTGARKNEMMSLVAPKLADDDIANLAAYYASLGCVPKPRP